MGEYVWTCAKVGGKVSAKVYEALLEMLEGDWEEEDSGLTTPPTTLYVAGVRNYGNADELVDFCRDHGLTIHLSWAAQPGCLHSGAQFWEPGLDRLIEAAANDDGEAVLTASELRAEMDAARSLADVIARLDSISASAVPPLEITDPENLDPANYPVEAANG